MSHRTRTALDFGPLVVFLAAYYFGGKDPILATGLFVVATFMALAIIYVIERKIAPLPLITGVIVGLFGGLTIYFNNEAFIMMKPTIVYVLMSGALFASAMTGKNFLGSAMSPYMKMTPEGWKGFLLRFSAFCLLMAGLNEILRRILEFELWLDVKVFGFMALFFLFSMSQAPYLSKHIIEDDELMPFED